MSVIIDKNGNTKVFRNLSNMVITGGKIYVEGKPLSELDAIDPNEKVINITIQGDVERLEVDYCKSIQVTGNAKRVHTQCGDIEVKGNVDGDVHTNCGSITCGNVEGDCHTNLGSISRR